MIHIIVPIVLASSNVSQVYSTDPLEKTKVKIEQTTTEQKKESPVKKQGS